MPHALCRGGRRSCLATLRTTRLRPAVATSAPSTYSTPSIYLLRESSSPGRLREPARSLCRFSTYPRSRLGLAELALFCLGDECHLRPPADRVAGAGATEREGEDGQRGPRAACVRAWIPSSSSDDRRAAGRPIPRRTDRRHVVGQSCVGSDRIVPRVAAGDRAERADDREDGFASTRRRGHEKDLQLLRLGV